MEHPEGTANNAQKHLTLKNLPLKLVVPPLTHTNPCQDIYLLVLVEGQGAGAGAYVPVYPRSSRSSYGPQYASYLGDTASFSYANSSAYHRSSSETRYGAGLEAAYRNRARSTSRSAQMDYRGAASTTTRMSTEYRPTTDSYSVHCRAAAQRRSRSMSRPVSSYGSYTSGPSSSLGQAQTYASTNPRANYLTHGRSRSNSSHRDY